MQTERCIFIQLQAKNIHLIKQVKAGEREMSEKEIQRLYDLLNKVTEPNEKAALRHAIIILENMQIKGR